MSAPFRVDSWAELPTAIARLQAAGVGHRVPLLRGLYRGDIAFLELRRDGASGQFKRWVAAAQLPGLVLLGDDDHARPDGPDSWRLAERVLRWARFVMVHGATGEADHYQMAVNLTQQFGRLAIIECSSASIEAWVAAANRWSKAVSGQVLRPAPGIVHPAPLPHKGRMQ